MYERSSNHLKLSISEWDDILTASLFFVYTLKENISTYLLAIYVRRLIGPLPFFAAVLYGDREASSVYSYK